MRTLNLGMIGLGTVGSGVARILLDRAGELQERAGVRLLLKTIVVRDLHKRRDVPLPKDVTLTTNPAAIVDDPNIDIALELMGSVEPAYSVIRDLLGAGKHVVTANKAVLAERGRELFALAEANQRAIRFEAAVAGGVPILNTVSQSLTANRVIALSGILNGTSNYILTAMNEEGLDYRSALAEAQAAGFAEADPTMDVDGTDAAQKLALLCRMAFESQVEWRKIRRRGIDTLAADDLRHAAELGYVVKLLAQARVEEGKLHLRVGPTLVRKFHPMAQIRGEYNAIGLVGDAVGDTFFSGKGAGMMPTASSVVADIVDLAIGRGQQTFLSMRLGAEKTSGPVFDPGAFLKSRFYFRYTIRDQPGTLARIAGILGDHGISISSVIQHETDEDHPGAAVPLILMTHKADEGGVWAAQEKIDALPIVQAASVCLPVAD